MQNTPEVIYNYLMKEQERKQEWDKKKILLFAVAIAILIGIVYILKTMMFAGLETPSSPATNIGVKGVSTEVTADPLPDIKKNIQNQIDSLKNEAQSINVVDIATSSPQVQKVINDLKAIQDYPKSQLKATCEKICSGL